MGVVVAPTNETSEAKPTEQTVDADWVRAAMSEPVVSVELPRLRFFCVWLLVLALRTVCAAYLLTLCLLYSVMATPELGYYARLLSPYSDSLFKPASWLAGVGAAAHGYQFYRILHLSLQARQATFANSQRSAKNQTTWVCHVWLPFDRTRLFRRMAAIAKRGYFELLGRQGFFGVESPYFEMRFLVREFLEMVSQTIQVYSASNLIAKRWINDLYIGVLFVNSFSTPLAKHFTRFSPALERLMCLTVDLLLDLITSVAVPLMIAAPYHSNFSTKSYGFEPKLLYSPTWFINLVMENRQVFVRNHFDMVLKATPHVCIFSCLGSIQSLVHARRSTSGSIVSTREPTYRQVAPSPVVPSPLSARDQPPAAVVTLPSGPSESRVLTSSKIDSRSRIRRVSVRIRLMQKHKMQERKAMVVHAMFIVWGVALVMVHVFANLSAFRDDVCGCKLQLHPWFTTKCACSVFEYNCIKQGSVSPSEDVFQDLDAKSVLVLVFSHCPALVVPTSIRQLHKLTGVEIWNSSILSWTSDAGITALTHPSMAYICIAGSPMSEIPDGILHNLPTELLDIEFSHTNLTSLPDDLDVRWPLVSTLYIEYAELSEWPETLLRMPHSDLSLAGNKLRSLPTLSAGRNGPTDEYYSLSFSNNPLQSLSDYTGDINALKFLSLENTLLEELPGWVETIRRHGFNVYLYGTPFCLTKTKAGNDSAYGVGAVLTCANTNQRAMGKYPFDEVAAQWRRE